MDEDSTAVMEHSKKRGGEEEEEEEEEEVNLACMPQELVEAVFAFVPLEHLLSTVSK